MFSEIKFSSEPQPFAFSSHRNPLFFFLRLTHICLNWDLANYTPYSTYEKRSASACFPSRALLLPCPSLGPSFDLAAETLKFGINAAIPSGPSGEEPGTSQSCWREKRSTAARCYCWDGLFSRRGGEASK